MALFTKFGRVKRMHIISQQGNNFLQAPWAGGITLVVCVVIAMLLANLEATAEFYHKFLHMELGLSIGGELFPEKMSVEKFVNDALMVVFFFTVGLEIRREMSHGELSTPKKAILPVVAALGGMLAPALIY
jgi:NhaA family Na+:H+ antiporter